MTQFIDYLEEKYAPIATLLQDEGNRQKLMKLGVSKNSKLVKLPMNQAIDNDEDLILFANIFPSGEEKLGKMKLIAGLKKTKARERLAKKTDVPSTWIGYKKGNDYEVWRPIEAGIVKGLKSCNKLDCLYDSDFAYKVVNPRKEELLRKFREETPGRKEWLTTGREGEMSINLMYKMYRNKLIKLLDKSLDYVNKKTINAFEENYIKHINNKEIKNTDFENWSEKPIDSFNIISSIISTLNDISKNKEKLDKKKLDSLINKIEKEIKNG